MTYVSKLLDVYFYYEYRFVVGNKFKAVLFYTLVSKTSGYNLNLMFETENSKRINLRSSDRFATEIFDSIVIFSTSAMLYC